MLGLFRNFFKSRFGVAITIAFLILIALAFASAGVIGGNFAGVAGGDTAAKVGKSRIGTGILQQTVTAAFENQRQKEPTLTMKQFLGPNGLNELLDSMIQRTAVWEWGERHGMAVSNRLVGSELAQIPAFQGPDGKFSEQAYRAAISQRRLSDETVRDDIAKGLMSREVLSPASVGARLPTAVLVRYTALFKERREGQIAVLPSLAFAPKAKPDDKTLEAYYKAHTSEFIRPERRVIRYAVIDDSTLGKLPPPTDAAIQKRYKANAAYYAPSETRTLTQLILPTEDAAKAIEAELAKGTSLEAAAKAKGLETAKLDKVTKESLAGQTSQQIADAAFATGKGKIVPLSKAPLGWPVLRVDDIIRNPGKTLEQAKPEIVTQLEAEAQRKALSDKAADADDAFSNGTSLADVAKTLGVTLTETPALTSDGGVYGQPGKKAPADIEPLVATAFSMDHEGEPQVAQVGHSQKFAIFDVSKITESAPAPFAEIKDDVAHSYMLDKGLGAAKTAADKVLAALGKGTSLAAALKQAGVPLPPPQTVSMTREQLAAAGNRVPPPLALMFSMAQGTNKRLEVGRKMGWFLVSLKKIIPADVKPDDPMVKSGERELGMVHGRELSDALRVAIANDIGAKRNPAAIAAVAKQLTGGGQ